MWPFAQVLAGVQHARSSAEAAGVEFDDNDTWFMLQPGVGITYITGDGWGIVGQVDYRRVFAGEDDDDGDGGAGGEVDLVEENQFRVFIGVRMILD